MRPWHVSAVGGALRISDDEERLYTVPASDIAHVLQAILRSCDTRPGEEAPSAGEILSGFEDEQEFPEWISPATLGREDRLAVR